MEWYHYASVSNTKKPVFMRIFSDKNKPGIHLRPEGLSITHMSVSGLLCKGIQNDAKGVSRSLILFLTV